VGTPTSQDVGCALWCQKPYWRCRRTAAGLQASGYHRELQSVAYSITVLSRLQGIHGWFPGAMAQRLFGEPTGTSTKFANMMETAVVQYMAQHGHKADRITAMPLEGDGTIERRVEKCVQPVVSGTSSNLSYRLYLDLMEHEDWVDDLHEWVSRAMVQFHRR